MDSGMLPRAGAARASCLLPGAGGAGTETQWSPARPGEKTCAGGKTQRSPPPGPARGVAMAVSEDRHPRLLLDIATMDESAQVLTDGLNAKEEECKGQEAKYTEAKEAVAKVAGRGSSSLTSYTSQPCLAAACCLLLAACFSCC